MELIQLVTEINNAFFKGHVLSGQDVTIDITHYSKGPRNLSGTVHHWVRPVFDLRQRCKHNCYRERNTNPIGAGIDIGPEMNSEQTTYTFITC